MSRVTELETELSAARARIAELENYANERPITIRQMKNEIAKVIGVELDGGNYQYMATVSRSDLVKIHAWIMARKGT